MPELQEARDLVRPEVDLTGCHRGSPPPLLSGSGSSPHPRAPTGLAQAVLPAIGFTPGATPQPSSPYHWPRVPRPFSQSLASSQRPRLQSGWSSGWPCSAPLSVSPPIGPSRQAPCLPRSAVDPSWSLLSLFPWAFRFLSASPHLFAAFLPAFCGSGSPGLWESGSQTQCSGDLYTCLCTPPHRAPFNSFSFFPNPHAHRLHSLTRFLKFG